MSNVVTATFFNGNRTCVTENLYQYDMGQTLRLVGIELPDTYRVDFSNDVNAGVAISCVGTEDTVMIPDDVLTSGLTVYAFVVIPETDSTTTIYRATIPVVKRPEAKDIEPTPEEQSTIDQLIALLNETVEATAEIRTLVNQIEANTQNISALEQTLFGSIEPGGNLILRRS